MVLRIAPLVIHEPLRAPPLGRVNVMRDIHGLRDRLGRIGYVAFWVVMAAAALGAFIDWLSSVPDQKPRAGEQCGPHHVWVEVPALHGTPDLSCEPL